VYRRIALDIEQGVDPHRTGRGDDAEVVAHQIDDHQIFGPLLGSVAQRLRRRTVGTRFRSARGCPFHGPHEDFSPSAGEEEFRRSRENAPVAGVEPGAKRSLLARGQPAIERERIARDGKTLPQGVIDLIGIPPRDRPVNSGDSRGVAVGVD